MSRSMNNPLASFACYLFALALASLLLVTPAFADELGDGGGSLGGDSIPSAIADGAGDDLLDEQEGNPDDNGEEPPADPDGEPSEPIEDEPPLSGDEEPPVPGDGSDKETDDDSTVPDEDSSLDEPEDEDSASDDDIVLEPAAPAGSTLNGVDVSGWNKGVDFSKLPGDFVIIKATEIHTDRSKYDPRKTSSYTTYNDYESQANAALRAGKLIGFYHFATNPVTRGASMIQQADAFVDAVKDYLGQAILVLDWENGSNSELVNANHVAWAKQWLDRVTYRTGTKPFIYMSKSVAQEYDWSSVANAGYKLWGAQYLYRYDRTTKEGKDTKYYVENPVYDVGDWGAWGRKPTIYQYSSTGKLAGQGTSPTAPIYAEPNPVIEPVIDVNIFYGTKEDWARYANAGWRVSSDGKKSYIDPITGLALTGWNEIGGKTYYFGSDGYAVRYSQTLRGTDGKQHFYYFNGNCEMQTGWIIWGDGTRSFFAQNSNYIPAGAAFTEWVSTGGNVYWFNPSNYRAVRYSQTLKGPDKQQHFYYFNGVGAMQTGWITWGDGTRSYFEADNKLSTYGSAASSWLTVDGKSYYINPANNRAVRYSQTLTGLDGKQHFYYFNGIGVMQTGWVNWNDGTRSFFAQNSNYIPTGAAFTHWVTTGGKTYWFSPSNFRAVRYSQKLVGRDGMPHEYYFNGVGVMQTGWVNFASKDLWVYYDEKTGAKTAETLVQGKIGKFISRMIYYCDTISMGYDQFNRWDFRDGGECDCSSLVIQCLKEAGFATGSATFTGNMSSNLTARGWTRISNPKLSDVQPGDILLNDKYHTCAVISGYGENAKIAQASIDENNYWNGGKGGDQTGRETYTRDVYTYSEGWDCILRYTGQ